MAQAPTVDNLTPAQKRTQRARELKYEKYKKAAQIYTQTNGNVTEVGRKLGRLGSKGGSLKGRNLSAYQTGKEIITNSLFDLARKEVLRSNETVIEYVKDKHYSLSNHENPFIATHNTVWLGKTAGAYTENVQVKGDLRKFVAVIRRDLSE